MDTQVPAYVPSDQELAFLAGGGEMGQLIRNFDWSSSSLGAPQTWPDALRTSVGIMLTTRHPVFIFWGAESLCFYNDAYRRSIGTEKHPGILGMPGRQAWPESWHVTGPQIEQVMNGGGSTWHENHLVPIVRNGTLENVYWTYSFGPIVDAQARNGIGGVLVLCNETTRHVEYTEQLALAEARWRNLFEQAPGFMCILREPGHVIEFANPGFYALLGVDQSILGQTVADAFPWIVEQGFNKLLDEVSATGKPFVGDAMPMQFPAKSGASAQLRYLDFVYQPFTDTSQAVSGIFVLGSDVTDRKLSEQRRDAFLATLGHELRNPIAPILNALELLKQRKNDVNTVTRAGDMIGRQMAYLVRLIDDLLDTVRVTRSRIDMVFADVSFNAIVHDTLELAATHIERGGHTIELHGDHEAVQLVADRMRLAQVFSNLLINACKYSDPQKTIRLVCRPVIDSHVTVRVEDQGIGISAQDIDHIFDIFSQINPSRNRSQGGLGIGLALSRGLVESHGGTLTVHSDGEGQGSVFEVRLPVVAPGAPGAPNPLD